MDQGTTVPIDEVVELGHVPADLGQQATRAIAYEGRQTANEPPQCLVFLHEVCMGISYTASGSTLRTHP